jgi:hypothetical protein
MLFATQKNETQTFEQTDAELLTPVAIPAEDLSSDAELLDLYAKIAETRPGTRDAEIFGRIRDWTFSDFTLSAHEFAGITASELHAWQRRHRINLSSGHIRPEHIDLLRGHHWGQVRRDDHVNGRHTQYGPPSREELLELMGPAR